MLLSSHLIFKFIHKMVCTARSVRSVHKVITLLKC
jgi:hypothetical protein